MIKIEVNGASIPEVADKLIAIGKSLKNGINNPWEPTTIAEAKAALGPSLARAFREVAEVAPVDPTPSQSTPEISAPSPDTSTTSEGKLTPPASASDAPVDKETLRSLVLAVVAAKGRETVEEILSTFGLAKASDVAAEQADELVEALKGAL